MEAAKKLFASRGFASVTIDEIAGKAGRPLPTVYALFQSKKGILKEVVERALFGQQYEALVQRTKEITHPEMNLLRGAVLVGPEFAELEREMEQRRFERQETNIKRLVIAKALRAGISVPTARDILWALTGRESYRLLVVERKWSSDRYEKWLGDLLISALLSAGA